LARQGLFRRTSPGRKKWRLSPNSVRVIFPRCGGTLGLGCGTRIAITPQSLSPRGGTGKWRDADCPEIADYQVNLLEFSTAIRAQALAMVHRIDASHIGGALSMADLLAVLYGEVLRIRPAEPRWSERDRFILSKGHSCSALYAALALRGFFPVEELETFGQDGSRLMTHISHKVPGVEFSTGSLGHGLGFGCGKALAAKRRKLNWRVMVMLSDGELDEGSNWEAFLFAAHHRLDNLLAIVDYNKIQSLGRVSEVLELEPLAEKLRAFRWAVQEVDGHNHEEVSKVLRKLPWAPGQPNFLIAHTIKGRGVSFMEDQLLWHYRSPREPQLAQALRELKLP
jgi:transketolase